MARTKQGPEFEIQVGGERYVWRLQRLPQWTSDTAKWRGKAIAVRHTQGQREAVLWNFPPAPSRDSGAPPAEGHADRTGNIVARAITSAIAAGMGALTRGKVVTIVVDESGG
jgi:hypothetical protein